MADRDMPEESGRPETSIVIRAFNEERWLPEVFSALNEQRYRNFEVVLVDSGSVDRTRDIAAANGARIVHLRSEDFTFGHSLNLGCRESMGKFLAILSAHAIPAGPDWLGCLIEPLRQPGTAMTYGGQRGHQVSKFAELRDFERIFPDREVHLDEDHPFANNANSAVRKDYWEKYPFDEGLPGLEDIDWAKHWLELGEKVIYQPHAKIIHVHTESWPQVRLRYYREAMAARWVGIRLLRHIPEEVLGEALRCAQDLWYAARQGEMISLSWQILRFRYEKTMGTVGGIIDSRGLNNPARRAENYFRKGFAAVVVHGPGKARIEEKKIPNLKPGEVLVRVAYVGVCPDDAKLFDGSSAQGLPNVTRYPVVPGQEFCGSVVAFGPRVTELKEGDRVVLDGLQGCGACPACQEGQTSRCEDADRSGSMSQDGAYAEYVVARASQVRRVPDALSSQTAVLAQRTAAVLKGMRRLDFRFDGSAPRRCAVLGARLSGQLAARILSMRGHDVTVIDRDIHYLERLTGVCRTSAKLSDLQCFDWLIDSTGEQEVVQSALDTSAPGATLLLLASPASHTLFDAGELVAQDRTLIGSTGSTATDLEAALNILQEFDAAVLIDAALPLTSYRQGWELAQSGTVLKVVLQVDECAADAPGLEIEPETANVVSA